MDNSWNLSNTDLLQQIGTLMWATQEGSNAPDLVKNLAMAKIANELYCRMTGEREVETLRNQTILAIAKYVKENPKASKEELAKEIGKQITLFSQRLQKI
ncbi:hypothetical protein FSP39_024483 [Pinctada imbricata]|uniref:Uncharacterized protein n=1 Tax=Pinctada imbricata TaxID=66713 RepID=A0AA88Y4M8_PINIB|nr:hypothetical protein FSP39_024483 [Pinctada imbricata]